MTTASERLFIRMARVCTLGFLLAVSSTTVATQAPSAAGPAFDVVSIKRNTTSPFLSNGSREHPDGGLTLVNIPVITLIRSAYTVGVPADYVGLPEWSRTERYDVIATASLKNPTREQRAIMMQNLLADRFQLLVHVEDLEQEVFDLTLARSDGRLGRDITPSAYDCAALEAERLAAAEASLAASAPPPLRLFDPGARAPCSVVMTSGMQGDMTLATLARFLRPAVGRGVVDKTGLTGSYHVTLAVNPVSGIRRPGTDGTDAPSIFTAVQEQLGLKLVPSRATRPTLVIDRLERPTEN